jgi:two-component system, NarL family, response regulator LiaR
VDRGQQASSGEHTTFRCRIVIADDHPLYRGALRGLLEQHPDFEVVGEGQDGVEALELCRRLRPEVVLMDARMPRMDGLEATRAIKQELPSTIVLLNTAIEEPNHLSEALRAGVSGYVLKTSSGSEITDAIRKALNGEAPLNQEISAQLLRRLLCEEEESRSFEQPQRAPLLGRLTQREVEVLRLVAMGQTNLQIAQSLLLSVSTVKKHIQHMVSKLEVSDRTQAAVKAIELGLLNEQD